MVGIWNPNSDTPREVDVRAAAFTLDENSRVLPTTAVYSDFYQYTWSQTYIFFNWSKNKTFSIHWVAHGRGRMFIDQVESEEIAKSLIHVQGRSTAHTLENTGGSVELIVGADNPLYCDYCYYVIEI